VIDRPLGEIVGTVNRGLTLGVLAQTTVIVGDHCCIGDPTLYVDLSREQKIAIEAELRERER
jgi:hypothetical protein